MSHRSKCNQILFLGEFGEEQGEFSFSVCAVCGLSIFDFLLLYHLDFCAVYSPHNSLLSLRQRRNHLRHLALNWTAGMDLAGSDWPPCYCGTHTETPVLIYYLWIGSGNIPAPCVFEVHRQEGATRPLCFQNLHNT